MGLTVQLRIIVALFVAMAGTFMPSPATAAARVPLSVCLARATPGISARTAFAAPELFDCARPQRNWRSGDFWALSAPLPSLAERRELNIRFASLWQRRIDVYVLYADGAIIRSGFTSKTAGRHLQLGAILSLPIPYRAAAPPVRILWHVEGAANLRGVVLGAEIATDPQNAARETMLAALYGAFGGMALALIVYNLALWGALRQRFQLVYCCLVLALLGYAASSSGALVRLLPMLDNNDRLRLNSYLLATSSVLAIGFARSFFGRRVFTPWLARASDIAMAAVGIATVACGLLSPRYILWTDHALTLGYVALIALVPAILWQAYRTRSDYLWLFALAWGAPIVFAGLRIASSVGLLRWSFWLDNSTIVSMMLEALLSSLAIAYRIRVLSRERDRAREQEIEARLLAATDPLTGLLNRRAFLERSIGRAGEQRLLLVDIDHFKQVNETIGHDGGDEVLRVVARALRAAVPTEALVARLGGEEFAIMVAADSPLSAAAVLDCLRAERMPFDLSVTASIGICTGPLAREGDWKAMYRSADRALFEAKAAGRDRARSAPTFSVAA